MNADPKLTFFTVRLHPGRLDRTVENAHGVMDLIDETASGFGQADAARVAVEEDDAKVCLQRLDPGADARLAGAEGQRRTMEAEIFRDGERLHQSDHRDTVTWQRRMI
ncbi:hypothetical protein SAMN06295955_12131 [Sphingopyxis indica]|uniref:Uncharacterized protein n=1 Tax=Sphingopyxis indica TaxID=436663 RepID=A0A239LBF0_9SPHN|nr:hypothetical protein SAMN06295955_12131 [Sphingopyxis indica]